ncbi:MAG: hypothetical protein HY052_01895 [Proteobacteria bacterium]|nr:hypothetical protein [Pseudomonadota bacterium]
MASFNRFTSLSKPAKRGNAQTLVKAASVWPKAMPPDTGIARPIAIFASKNPRKTAGTARYPHSSRAAAYLGPDHPRVRDGRPQLDSHY